MSDSDRDRWDSKYRDRAAPTAVAPDDWLVEAVGVINREGSTSPRRAVDVACGLGHNAIWLAQQGWQVDGIDVSREGLRLARTTAHAHDCDIKWIAADLDDWEPERDAYDLVLVFRFLDRISVPRVLSSGLRAGGWLVYETFSIAQLQRPDSHIQNPAFTLAAGELNQLFPECDAVVDRIDVLDDRTVCRFLARKKTEQ